MLSRFAEAMYWMERYRERAENIARFIDVNLHLGLDLPQDERQEWGPLVKTSGGERLFLSRYGEATEKSVIEFLTFDEHNPNSILSCFKKARENAHSIRPTISTEVWQEVNTAYLFIRDACGNPGSMQTPYQFYNRIRRQCELMTGLMDSTMSHGEAWHFARLGRLLERADKTSRILDVKYFMLLPSPEYVGTPYDNLQWGALLKSASAFEMYRKKFHQIDSIHVVDFLVLSRDFPRAIYFCLAEAQKSLHVITGTPSGHFNNPTEKFLGRLCADLGYLQVEDIVAPGIHEFLNEMQSKFNEINDGIFNDFFAFHPIANIS